MGRKLHQTMPEQGIGSGGISVRKFVLAAGLISLVLTNRPAKADVELTFDDLGVTSGSSGQINTISPSYGGLTWSSDFWVQNTTGLRPSGFLQADETPPSVAYNSGGGEAEISDPSSGFTLNTAYFTAVENDGLSIAVNGYDKNDIPIAADSVTLTANTTGPTLETFDWANVYYVTFLPSGGTLHTGYLQAGTVFAMDTLTINGPVSPPPPPPSVPEPSAVTLLAIMLGLVGFTLRLCRQI